MIAIRLSDCALRHCDATDFGVISVQKAKWGERGVSGEGRADSQCEGSRPCSGGGSAIDRSAIDRSAIDVVTRPMVVACAVRR
ncbi:hypothetical protein EF294_19710 [Gordonia oryzae]|uniref:Uncharacterized protein n=1 Tax=Gordonia oryzae TaxID=2487349 RepID=A0A3N4G403_9ACTN|nr:hypothetical protein EF294_19710 [Gordonia oryzae]